MARIGTTGGGEPESYIDLEEMTYDMLEVNAKMSKIIDRLYLRLAQLNAVNAEDTEMIAAAAKIMSQYGA